MRSPVLYAVLALLWMGGIFYTSSLGSRELKVARSIYVAPHRAAHWASGTNVPAGIWGRVDRQDYTNILDKPPHALAYAVLTLLWWRSFSLTRRKGIGNRAVLLAALIAFIFGCSDEYHQSFSPGRQMRLDDLAANCVGIAAVSAACIVFRSRPPATIGSQH